MATRAGSGSGKSRSTVRKGVLAAAVATALAAGAGVAATVVTSTRSPSGVHPHTTTQAAGSAAGAAGTTARQAAAGGGSHGTSTTGATGTIGTTGSAGTVSRTGTTAVEPAAVAGDTADAAATTAGKRAVGAAPKAPAGSTRLGTAAPATTMRLSVGLAPRDPQGLADFVQQVSTPGSPLYHQYLTPSQFAERFGATPDAVAEVSDALRAAGLNPGRASSDGLSIPVTATAATVKRALGTRIDDYRLPDGRQALLNATAPELRASVAGLVDGITGLNTVVRPSSAHTTPQVVGQAPDAPAATGTSATASTATAASTTGALLGSGSTVRMCSGAAVSLGMGRLHDTVDYYSPASLASVYGLSHAMTAGSGVTVGVFELENVSTSDISAYQTCFGTSSSVSYVKVDGGPKAAPNAAKDIGVESALDIEDLIGLAPGASIVDYEGPDASAATDTDVVDVYRKMVTDRKVQIISTSWGSCESEVASYDPGMIAQENAVFEEAASFGETVVAASGDAGSTGCFIPGADSSKAISADDPATQPTVTGVGGTTMQGAPGAVSQSVWNTPTGASGGGVSSSWALDSSTAFQQGLTGAYTAQCAAPSGSVCRTVPDVSALADPDTGYVVFAGGSVNLIGGTSAAAPTWAALLAQAESGAACKAHGALGDINPALYSIAAGSSGASAFSDVATGSNDWARSGYAGGLYQAGVGYDLATGLGTPKFAGLSSQLCGS